MNKAIAAILALYFGFVGTTSAQRFYASTSDLDLCASYHSERNATRKEQIKQEIISEGLTKGDWRWNLGVENNYVVPGMNKCELFAALGKKEPASTTRSTYGTNEMFHYGKQTIFVDNGIISSIYE